MPRASQFQREQTRLRKLLSKSPKRGLPQTHPPELRRGFGTVARRVTGITPLPLGADGGRYFSRFASLDLAVPFFPFVLEDFAVELLVDRRSVRLTTDS